MEDCHRTGKVVCELQVQNTESQTEGVQAVWYLQQRSDWRGIQNRSLRPRTNEFGHSA